MGKSRMNFNRGEQRKSVGLDDEGDFDWRDELAREANEQREYEKRIKQLGLDKPEATEE